MLTALVRKSLLRREETDERRGALPHARDDPRVRARAAGGARRGPSGSINGTRSRSADPRRAVRSWSCAPVGRARRSWAAIGGPTSTTSAAALRWADTAAPELMLQIGGLLKLFWRVRGHLDEGRRWLETPPLPTTAPRQRAAGSAARGRRPPLRNVEASTRRRRRPGRKLWRSGARSGTTKGSPERSATSPASSTSRATLSTRFRCMRKAQTSSAHSGSTTSSEPSSRTTGSV